MPAGVANFNVFTHKTAQVRSGAGYMAIKSGGSYGALEHPSKEISMGYLENLGASLTRLKAEFGLQSSLSDTGSGDPLHSATFQEEPPLFSIISAIYFSEG